MREITKGQYSVYMHIFPNNKKYVGITCRNVKIRWGRNGKGYCSQNVYKAIKKYGWENIEHLVLFTNLSEMEAKTKEIELIARYNTFNPAYGYNLTTGGEGCCGLKVSKERRKQISELMSVRMIGNNYNKGKQRNKKYADKISKKVMCVETGEIFASEIEASRLKKIHKSNLHYAVVGVRKSAGGFHWKRVR